MSHSLKSIDADSEGLRIGAMVTLEDLARSSGLRRLTRRCGRPSAPSAACNCNRKARWAANSASGRAAGTSAPARDCSPIAAQLVEDGDNRYHAIFGNAGPAKFVCPSRLAPALIALGASVRIVGPGEADETVMPLEYLFRTPKDDRQREHELEANQFVGAPGAAAGRRTLPSASYEVQHGSGPDYPLVAAAAARWPREAVS